MISIENNKTVRLHDKDFRVLIPYSELKIAILDVAKRINDDYKDRERPLFIGVLNGSFMFMSELLQNIEFNCESTFVKITSYSCMSSGNIRELIGLSDNIEGRHVVIVEDIVDTGNSVDYLIRSISGHRPASIAVATLLFKEEAYVKDFKIDYYALKVPDKFIIGFGLDYNQLGRNLKDIYEVINE